MRYLQVGILACLVTISGLLFAIYREQAVHNETLAEVDAFADFDTPSDDEFPPVEYAALHEEPTPPIAAVIETPQPGPRPRRAAAPPRAEIAQPEPAPIPRAAPAPVIPVAHTLELTEERRVIEAPLSNPPPMPARTVTLDVGTPLRVRLTHTLSTERNEPGDTFTASLEQAIVQDGLVIAERGAQVDGRVVDARRAGRVKGRSFLAIELTTLHTGDGQQVSIVSSEFAREGESTKREDLEKVGIGAGVGALIGAIAGGGKGAAIGAATGAGAGAGTAAAVRGEPIVLRPETRLDFQLDEPVSITEQL